MSHIKKAKLVAEVAGTAHRVDAVRKDPAVVKAASEAGADIAQAFKSSAKAVAEVQNSWRRTYDAS